VNVFTKRKALVGAAAALAVGGTGAGIAATRMGRSPSDESQAVISDAARQLGVQPLELTNALKKALKDHIDAEVAAGRLTKAEGDALKKRIESGGVPLVAPPLFGFGRHLGQFGHFGFPGLSTAASYLGLTERQVRDRLGSGKTLAEIAQEQGKSVDGLVAALKDGLKSRLDDAVAAGRLTKAQQEQILANAEQRIRDFVNGKLRPPRPEGGWFRPHRSGFDFGGRPPIFPDAA
jgi:uncharacterized protein YidB (DUF937 family)